MSLNAWHGQRRRWRSADRAAPHLAQRAALPLDAPCAGLQTRAGAQLEIRLAETAPAAGLREAVVPGLRSTASTCIRRRSPPMRRHQRARHQHGRTVRRAVCVQRRSIGADAKRHRRRILASHSPSCSMATSSSAPTLRAPIGDSAVITGTSPPHRRRNWRRSWLRRAAQNGATQRRRHACRFRSTRSVRSTRRPRWRRRSKAACSSKRSSG